MVITGQSIELVAQRIKPETQGCMSIIFDRPAQFVFEAGDWIDIEFKGKVLRGGKTYSLSSSPTESDIAITFKKGVSELKTALQATAKNDVLLVTQYGNDYDFRLKQHQSSVLIAGGVGIAPFRSMIKQLYDTSAKNEVLLIYLNSNDEFVFKEELDIWSDTLPNLRIEYILAKGLSRKKRENVIRGMIKNINQNFYISAPPAMVEANEHLLIDLGVRVADIRVDSFGGYE